MWRFVVEEAGSNSAVFGWWEEGDNTGEVSDMDFYRSML